MNMLTLADIVTATCLDPAGRAKWRSALIRLLDYEEIRELAGETRSRNGANRLFPESSLPFLHRLYELRGAGHEPRELANILRREQERRRQADQAQPVTDQPHPAIGQALDLTVRPDQAADWVQEVTALVAGQTAALLSRDLLPPVEEWFLRITEIVAAQAAAQRAEKQPIENRLVRLEEVAQMLACGKESAAVLLRRHEVDPVLQRPRRWKRNDVLLLIDSL